MRKMKNFDVPKKDKNNCGGFDTNRLDKEINKIVEIQHKFPSKMLAEMLLELAKEYQHKL